MSKGICDYIFGKDDILGSYSVKLLALRDLRSLSAFKYNKQDLPKEKDIPVDKRCAKKVDITKRKHRSTSCE